MSPYFAYLSVDPDTKQVLNAHIKEAPLSFTGHPVKTVDPVVYKQGYRFIGTFTSIHAAENACADAFMNRIVVRDGVTYWRKRSPINKLAVIHSSKEKYLVTFHRNGELFSYEPSKPSIDRLNRVMKNMTPASIDVKFYVGVMITYQA